MERQIINQATGDRMIFLASPMLGDGDTLIFRGILPANAAGAPLHTHDAMTKTFLVEDGSLEIDLGGGMSRRLGPGDDIVIAPGTPHGFRNPLDRETRFVTTATPGAELERFLRSLYAMANAGQTDAAGAPQSALAMAAVLAPMDMALAGMPWLAQRLAIGTLAMIAGLVGIDSAVDRLVFAPSDGRAL